MDTIRYANEWLDLIEVENGISKKVASQLQKMIGSSFVNYDILLTKVDEIIFNAVESFDDIPVPIYGTDAYYDIDLNYSDGKFKGFTLKTLFLNLDN